MSFIIIFECTCVCSYRLNLGIIVIKYKINIMSLPITKVTTHYCLFIMTKRTVKINYCQHLSSTSYSLLDIENLQPNLTPTAQHTHILPIHFVVLYIIVTTLGSLSNMLKHPFTSLMIINFRMKINVNDKVVIMVTKDTITFVLFSNN